ncbi:hypothetical protein ASG82_23555 [Mycobacterium sp. Soil538]|nr:hypothetical protein ASG82_23555 [Mycobacterium sp. Soil538]
MSSVMAWLRWRWARLRARSPLVRGTDRVEAAGLVAAIAISAAMLMLGSVVGADVQDSRMADYRAHLAVRHQITATVVGTSPVRARSSATSVRTVWRTGIEEHTGTVISTRPVGVGDRIAVWVNDSRSEIVTPMSAWQVSVDALGAALAVWLAGTACALGLFALLRMGLRRRRFREWESALSRLRAPTA